MSSPPDRAAEERQREQQIRRQNLAEAIRARIPFWRNRIDRSTGRQHKDPVNRRLYRNRVQSFRDMNERNRQLREQLGQQSRAAGNQRYVRESLPPRSRGRSR